MEADTVTQRHAIAMVYAASWAVLLWVALDWLVKRHGSSQLF